MHRKIAEHIGVAFYEERRSGVFLSTATATLVCAVASVAGFLPLDPVAASVVTALVILSGLLIVAARVYRRALHISLWERATLGEPPHTPEVLFDGVASSYGAAKDMYSVVTEILADGSSDSVISQTVRAVSYPVDRLEYTYSVTSLHPTIGEGVSVSEVATSPGHIVSMRPVTTPSSTKSFFIWFEPPIKVGDTVSLTFRRASPPHTYVLEEKDLHPGQSYEFSRQEISFPTRILSRKLVFPLGYSAADIILEATVGRTEMIHRAETARLIDNDCLRYGVQSDGRMVIEFRVDYPIHGLRYIVHWRPFRRSS